MPEKEESKKEGLGKYILINELREKYADVFYDPGTKSAVSDKLYLEGIHFSLVYFPLQHLGYKTVVDSIADIYCRNLIPAELSISIGVSTRFKREDIENLIEGMSLACKRYGPRISSLDISSSLTGLSISIASHGKENKGHGHEATHETDIICVTGDLGAAFLGLQLLERERKVFESTGGAQPKLEGFEYVIGRQLKPELNTGLLDRLRKDGMRTGTMRVIRDGLASELIHISGETGMGCRIYHDRLPIAHDTAAAGKELGFEPLIAALNGGDDFEFLFTVPVDQHAKIEKTEGLSIIGHLVSQDQGNSLVLQDGSLAELKAQGWEESDES